MFLPYLVVFFPALIHAEITVDIDTDNKAVHYSGSNVSIVTDKDMETFGLSDEILKKAATAVLGKRPTDVYVRSPTPSRDLYRKYDWQQVTKTLIVESARILEINEEPFLVQNSNYHNPNNKSSTFNGKMSKQVTTTVTSSWSNSEEFKLGLGLAVGKSISKLIHLSAKLSFGFTSKWGQTSSESRTEEIGSELGFAVSNMNPHDSVKAHLIATKGTMKIEVNYIASLSGDVAMNFYYRYKGEQFWSYPVADLIEASGKKNMIKAREEITIEYYGKASVVMR